MRTIISGVSCLSLLCVILFNSCSKNLQKETVVYKNNFNDGDLSGITNGKIFKYNGSNVLGRFNNDGFLLTINNLPDHDLIRVSIDLYIHDSWDGNVEGIDGADGPDFWQMNLDGARHLYTTFSNNGPQSYPNGYLVQNNAKSNAYKTDLPGVCSQKDIIGGTSMYKIVRTIQQDDKTFTLECLDKLKQTIIPDTLCDESWSVGSIEVKVIKLR